MNECGTRWDMIISPAVIKSAFRAMFEIGYN
jgi:hypothetical protein